MYGSRRPLTRVPEVSEAMEIAIELGERSGDLETQKRAACYVVGGDEAFLRTAARRLKYEYLLWRIVAWATWEGRRAMLSMVPVSDGIHPSG